MFYVLGLAFLLAGVWLLVLGSRLYGQPKVGDQISLWRGTVPLNNESPQRFYTRLYQALRTSLQDRFADGDGTPFEVVLTGMGFGPHRLFAAPSLFAERPLYLLVRYKHLRCYIYAGQTPTGLFISAWGYSDYHAGEGQLGRLLPIKRAWMYFTKQTLFQFDAAHMFTTSVHEIIFETLNGCLQEKGLKPLEELEKRPILHDFYRNPFGRDYGKHDVHKQDDDFPHSYQRASAPQASADAHPRTTANDNAPTDSQAVVMDTAPPTNHVAPVMPPSPEPLFPMDEWTAGKTENAENISDSQASKVQDGKAP